MKSLPKLIRKLHRVGSKRTGQWNRRANLHRARRLFGETLEARSVPAQLLLVDFDGATLTEVEDTFRRLPGWLSPADAPGQDRRSFVDEIAALQTQYGGYSLYSWLDMNSDGALNRTDGDLVVQHILARVEEDYLGNNLRVEREDSTNLALDRVADNPGGDTYMFVWGTHNPAAPGGLGGQTGGDRNNSHDDAAGGAGSVALARDLVNGGWSGAAALNAFVNNIADVISHEAGHSWGLEHITTSVHPQAQGVDVMTPSVGTENLRFRDLSYTVDAADIGMQNSRRFLFDTLGARDPISLTFSPSRVLRITGDSNVNNVDDVITVDLQPLNPTVTINGVTRLVAQSAVDSIVIDAGDGNDIINLEYTGNRPVTITGGENDDTLNVSPSARNLLNVNGIITFFGGSFVSDGGTMDAVHLFDDNNPDPTTYSVINTTVLIEGRTGFAVLARDSERLEISAGSSTTTAVNLSRTSIPTRVNRAAILNVGNSLSGVQEIRAAVEVENNPRFTTLNINDGGNIHTPRVATFDIDGNIGYLAGLAPATISWDTADIAAINLTTGSQANHITVLRNSEVLNIDSTAGGNDRLAFGPALPTPVYVSDASGQPGNGTVDVGGVLIHFQGLEFVDDIPPEFHGVQLEAVTIDENGVATVTGTFTDPGSDSTHAVRINWGDGTTDPPRSLVPGARSFTLTHRYLDDNPTTTTSDVYIITATLTDNDNFSDSATTSVTVENVPPVITSLSSDSASSDLATEGEAVTIQGAFTDVGTRDTHTVTVDWGDGVIRSAHVTEAGGGGIFSDQHTYQFGGIYTVLVTVRDDDSGAVAHSTAVFITGIGVHEVDGRRSLQVVGTLGSDHVTINQQGKGQVKVHANFLTKGHRTLPLAGLDLIQVVLLAGNDHAGISGSVDLPAVLDGGDGDDHLDGGNAGSVVIGGRGSDHLNGGNARDVLIGSLGTDRLVGNGSDDVLIGGFTAYDSGSDDVKLANDMALLHLLDEWSSGRSYPERIANLRDGAGPILGGAGFSLRKGATVFDDLDSDVMTGSSGVDWFFSDALLDKLNGRHSDERTD
jgi:hypothetical protein